MFFGGVLQILFAIQSKKFLAENPSATALVQHIQSTPAPQTKTFSKNYLAR
jgi:hypothetical protein